MRDNPEGVELDSAVDDRRHCKTNSFVLSFIDKRTKESCSSGSEIWAVHSG